MALYGGVMMDIIFRAVFDNVGFPTGFYPSDVWPEAYPEAAITITREQWLEFINHPGFRRWENGQVIEYTPPPQPTIFAPLSARQLRLGLVSNGFLLSQVEAAIDAIEDQQAREVARIEWEYASTFERNHPLIEQVGSALGLMAEHIDSMWLAASTL